MVLITAVAILLTLNMILTHADKLYEAYVWVYKKIKKPKFSTGEFVLINNLEYEIIFITKKHIKIKLYLTIIWKNYQLKLNQKRSLICENGNARTI